MYGVVFCSTCPCPGGEHRCLRLSAEVYSLNCDRGPSEQLTEVMFLKDLQETMPLCCRDSDGNRYEFAGDSLIRTYSAYSFDSSILFPDPSPVPSLSYLDASTCSIAEVDLAIGCFTW